MKVYLATDHGGFELKEKIKEFLIKENFDVKDFGAETFDPEDDYPDFVIPMARKVAADAQSLGIAVGASGQGEAMAANRVKGVRAAVYYGPAHEQQVDVEGNVLDHDVEMERITFTRWKPLERDVFIQDIEAPGPSGSENYDKDYWLIFRQDGTIPPHVVHFVTKKGLRMSLEIEEITGGVTVKDGHVAFYAPQESEFQMLGGEALESK